MNNQDKIIKIKQVCEIVGVSQSTVRRLLKKGKFPDKVEIYGSTRCGWSLHQVCQYIEDLKATNHRPALVYAKTWRTDRSKRECAK